LIKTVSGTYFNRPNNDGPISSWLTTAVVKRNGGNSAKQTVVWSVEICPWNSFYQRTETIFFIFLLKIPLPSLILK
jgi:hypothetical protein